MKKVIEAVPSFPVGCESSLFFGAVTSLHMSVKDIDPNEHEFIFHVLYSVSGAGLLRLHQSDIPHEVKGYDADDMIRFVPDLIPYTMQYLGYEYKKVFCENESYQKLRQEIAASIDKNIPVICKVKGEKQWALLCSYDEDMTDTAWLDSIEYVLICTPVNRSITFKSALLRMCSLIEQHLSDRLNAHTLLLKRDDTYFAGQSQQDLKQLYAYIDSILSYLMECSHHVSEAFGAVWKRYVDNPAVNPRLQDLFSQLDGVISRTQGTVWEHWNYKPDGIEKFTLLKHEEYRDTLLHYFDRIAEDDAESLALIRQSIALIDDSYIDLSI